MKTENTKPNFRRVPPADLDQAAAYWNAGRYASALVLVPRDDRAAFLMDNLIVLQDAGAYEQALFLTYCHGARQSTGVWKHFVGLASREKLRACGGPVPAEPVRIFRGAESSKVNCLRRGVSWTTNPNTAAWFATRGKAPHPVVYATTLKTEWVIFTRQDRQEEEIVVAGWEIGRVEALKELPVPIRPGLKGKEARV